MDGQDNSLIIIAGPTGIGKSAIAHALAKHLQCDIFSADSRQVYKEMRIGTAVPPIEYLHEVHYHFIQNVSIHQQYDVGTYVEECREALQLYFQSHQHAILVGGTGLYIQALTQGIDTFPEVEEEIKLKINALYQKDGLAFLQEFVQTHDEEYYSLVDKNNPRRLMRAAEVILSSGKPYSSFRLQNNQPLPYNVLNILLEMDRSELYHRINHRVDDMLENGLVGEAKSLYQWRQLKALDTVGYKELFDHFDGLLTLQEAVDLIKQNTRRYAKRQLTWFNKFGDWKRLPAEYVEVENYIKVKLMT